MTFQIIAPDELDHYIQDEESVIIDVREEAEYQRKHVKGAINIPYEKWENDEESELLRNMIHKKKVILYCERGPTSFAAAKELAKKGIAAGAVVGGIRAYRGKMTERY